MKILICLAVHNAGGAFQRFMLLEFKPTVLQKVECVRSSDEPKSFSNFRL